MSVPENSIVDVAVTAELSTQHAREMLHKRYCAPEWSMMEEVAPATGGGTRYADAVAMNLWQSRGHAIHGFEIKVSRSDWLRELKDPAKAESVLKYCDYWWIVAPAGVIKDGELPPTWGHLELRASSLLMKVAGLKLSPVPLTREFFASMMRRGYEGLSDKAERMQRATVNAARADIDKRVNLEIEQRSQRFNDLTKKVKEFEEKTGLIVGNYANFPINTIKLAQQLQKLEKWHGNRALERLEELRKGLEDAAAIVAAAITETGLCQ